MFKYNKGFTHGGNFHSDDVFATAFLRLLNPNIEIIRGFEIPQCFDGIIYDIGNGRYDHHSKNGEYRDNGILYASFGKLWRDFADLIVSDYVKEFIDRELISPLDNSDNTGERDTLSSSIYAFNSLWDEEESEEKQNKLFFEAVNIAQKILIRYIEKFKSVERAEKYVLECYNSIKNGVVVLNRYAPWNNILHNTDTKVVIYPSNRGGWNAERIENKGFEFPKEWWGTRDEKITGLLFCHPSGFMCNFDTLEDAISAVEKLIK